MAFSRIIAHDLILAAGAGGLLGEPLESLPPWARAAFWIWIAVLGACVGSFLNVVIYRLPRGMSLMHPGSHCPACGHPIRARDNLPVVGWLLLRGRCRDCKTSISPRYPLIESLVAMLFVGTALMYLGTGGATLPTFGSACGGSAWTEQRLAAVCLFQLLLLMYLLAAAGMRSDGQRVPRWLTNLLAAIGFVAPCIWPWLRPISSTLTLHSTSWTEGLAGGIAGATVGWLVDFLRTRATYQHHRLYVLLGLILGWQYALITAVAAAILTELIALAIQQRQFGRRLPEEVATLTVILLLLPQWTLGVEHLRGIGSGLFLAAGVLSLLAATAFQRRLPAGQER